MLTKSKQEESKHIPLFPLRAPLLISFHLSAEAKHCSTIRRFYFYSYYIAINFSIMSAGLFLDVVTIMSGVLMLLVALFVRCCVLY